MGTASGQRRPSAEALTLFFRSLAVMFSAGVPIDRALQMLSEQSEDQRMANIAADINQRINQGIPLHTAFQQQRQAFSHLQLALLKIGERTGRLEKVLHRLADYEEKRRHINMKVKSALTYPAFLMIITGFMLIVIPPYMFQGLFAMLESSSTELPLITKFVVAVSNFIRTPYFWLLVIVSVLSLVLALPKISEHGETKLHLSKLILQLPIAGDLFRILGTTRFARALELQLQVGEAPLTGLPIAGMASDNPVLQESILSCVDGLKSGSTFVESLALADFFPNAFLSMLRAGEESAQLPDIVGRSAEMYEAQLDQAIDTFSNLLEPLVMLVMGVLVGIVVVATMLPMIKMIETL
jgi:type IV pilus assembly protein PilC